MAIQNNELAQLLALWRLPGVGPSEFFKLIDSSDSLHAALMRAVAGGKQLRLPLGATSGADWATVEKDLAWIDTAGNHIISWFDEHYPALLREIPDPPPILFGQGNLALLNRPQLAIVGSRKASPYGRSCAQALSGAMAERGWVITSGLALGIDGIAHQAALDGGLPTISVEATGLDRVYPRAHTKLAANIVSAGGLRLSEFGVGAEPLKAHFPRRNRIISGLARGTLVVEADIKSGSLITARAAATQGRDVFAVPGPIFSSGSRGCHYLIKEGAKLVETADDISEEIGIIMDSPLSKSLRDNVCPDAPTLHGKQGVVFDQLGYEPTPVDSLVERTGLTTQEVTSVLMELEIQGVVTVMPGGLYTRQALREADR